MTFGKKCKLLLLCIKISVCNSLPVLFLNALTFRMCFGLTVRDKFGEYVIEYVYRLRFVRHISYSYVCE